MRNAVLVTRFATCEVVEEIDPQEDAGDEFACLEDDDCAHPGGHLFKTQCGVTRCVHCPKIAWR